VFIASDRNLAYDPRVGKLARALDVSLPAALGHLHFLWYWCLTYAASGDISPARVRQSDLARGAQWGGDGQVFVDALMRSGFVAVRDDGVWLADWDALAGRSLGESRRNRRKNATRRAKQTPG
jgi:hypothetical protein